MSGKQAEVQPAEIHPLYLCQFVFYGCVFANILILTDKNTSAFSYVLIKVQLLVAGLSLLKRYLLHLFSNKLSKLIEYICTDVSVIMFILKILQRKTVF